MCFGANFIEGQDYEVITETSLINNKKDVAIVTEFFSYGCPWCYKLEPALDKWLSQQGSKTHFKKVPVIFNKDWEFYARAFYTAQALALNSKFNPALFKAIIDDKQVLNTSEAMINFFIKNGVDAATAKSAFTHSPSIDLDIANSQRLMTKYRIAGVPAFIVNNRFKTNLEMAKSEKRLFEIINFLMIQETPKK